MSRCSSIPICLFPIQFPTTMPEFFSQFQATQTFLVQADINDNVAVTTPSICVSNIRFVPSVAGTSAEGQILTGKNLIVIGYFNTKIVITRVENGVRKNNTVEKVIPFSTNIVVPLEDNGNHQVFLGFDIQDFSAIIIARNTLFCSISLVLTYDNCDD
ncbi:hypothetical protein [Lachnoclostridium sp.]|nr:hypothetical protein [Lachnoclostridium sp.]